MKQPQCEVITSSNRYIPADFQLTKLVTGISDGRYPIIVPAPILCGPTAHPPVPVSFSAFPSVAINPGRLQLSSFSGVSTHGKHTKHTARVSLPA